jgi:hypothetical protein
MKREGKSVCGKRERKERRGERKERGGKTGIKIEVKR